MNNHKFYWLLHEARERNRPRWTVARLAQAVGSSRAHVTETLNNVPGHGHRTRAKLVAVLRDNFTYWRDMLEALGWTVEGEVISDQSSVTSRAASVFHMESSN